MKKSETVALPRIILMFLFFLLFIVVGLSANDNNYDIIIENLFKIPAINPTLTGSFTESMHSIHTGMAYNNAPNYFYTDMKGDLNMDHLSLNLFIGSMLSITKNITIPFFFSWVANDSGDIIYDGWTRSREGTMVGGGLIIYGSYGVIGIHVGYAWENSYESILHGEEQEWSQEKLHWAVFPIINAKNAPLLNILIQIIDGFFSMDNLRMDRDEFKPTYKANILFNDLTLNESTISLETYTLSDWYGFDTKYNLYAGKINFTYGKHSYDPFIIPIISIDVGYREFFDIQNSTQVFENGIYSKICLKLFFPGYDGLQIGLMCYFESGSQAFFNDSKFGFMFSMQANLEPLCLPVKLHIKDRRLDFKNDFYVRRK